MIAVDAPLVHSIPTNILRALPTLDPAKPPRKPGAHSLVTRRDLAKNVPGLTGTERAVLIALLDFADDDFGSVFPSLKTIATVAGVARSTVQKALGSLRKKGALSSWAHRSAGRGRGRLSNLYALDAARLRGELADTDRRYLQGALTDTENGRSRHLQIPTGGNDRHQRSTKHKCLVRADTPHGTLGLWDGSGEGGMAQPALLAEPSPSPTQASGSPHPNTPALALEFEETKSKPKKRGKREPSALDLAAWAILAAVWLVVIAEHPGLGMTRKTWFTRNANAARDLASLESPKTPEQVANGFRMLYTDPLCIERGWNRIVMLAAYQEHLHDLHRIIDGKVRPIRRGRA